MKNHYFTIVLKGKPATAADEEVAYSDLMALLSDELVQEISFVKFNPASFQLYVKDESVQGLWVRLTEVEPPTYLAYVFDFIEKIVSLEDVDLVLIGDELCSELGVRLVSRHYHVATPQVKACN